MNSNPFSESSFVLNNLRNMYLGGTETEGTSIVNKLTSLTNSLNSNSLQNDVHPSYNPNYVPSREELLSTETLDRLIQNGGARNMIKGLRNVNNLQSLNEFSELTESSEMYDNLIGGRRNKPNPTDDLHQEALDYLKNDLKLSPLESRAYKSLAYRHVKEKNPELTGLERAKLMLSLVKSENFLDQFKEKLDETMEIIKSVDEEREKRMSEQGKTESKGEEKEEKKEKKKRSKKE